MDILPEVLEQEIKDMACVKRHNNKDSRDFYLRFITSTPKISSDHKIELEKWILYCLDKLDDYEVTSDGGGNNQSAYNLVTEYMEGDEDWPGELVVCIHFKWWGSEWQIDKHDLIVTNESPPSPPLLSADTLLDCFRGEPKWCTKIGVSGVSPQFIAERWWSCIGGEEGYMTYSMWKKLFKGEDWINVRERSFNFGWDNYPPHEIAKF